ncbi:MAG: DUF5678 domain-containing protein [bacterium]|nr:DUF5678 domain-containing protein [bacterium]
MKVTTDLLSEEFWNDDKWVHENYQGLSEKFPNQWVAVADKKVVSAGENLERVETEAEKKTGKRDFPLLFIERGAYVYKD